jgi:hypothetical protein
MSQASIRNASISRYTYMATAMARSLSEAIKASRVSEKMFSQGVLAATLRFFHSVRRAFEDEIPDSMLQTARDYNIAFDALMSVRPSEFPEGAADEKLSQFAAFVDSLQRPHKLLPYEIELALLLWEVFYCIANRGDIARYDEYMGG